jgi:hypothetical protein
MELELRANTCASIFFGIVLEVKALVRGRVSAVSMISKPRIATRIGLVTVSLT